MLKGFPKERGQHQTEVSGSKPGKKSLFKRFTRGGNKSKGLDNECNRVEDDDSWKEPSNNHPQEASSAKIIGESSSSLPDNDQNDPNSPQSVSGRASNSSPDGLDQSSMNEVTDNKDGGLDTPQSVPEQRPSISTYYDPSIAVMTSPFGEEDPDEMPPEMTRFTAIRRQQSPLPQLPRQNMIETATACRRPTAFELAQTRSQSEATVSATQSTKPIRSEVMVKLNSDTISSNDAPVGPTRNTYNRRASMGNIKAKDTDNRPRLSLPPTNTSRGTTGSPNSDKSDGQKSTLEVAVQKGILNHLQQHKATPSNVTPTKSNSRSSSNESELASRGENISMPRIAMQDMGRVDALYNDMKSTMPTRRSDSSEETFQTTGRPYVLGLPFTKDRIPALSNRSGVASRASSEETPITAPGRSKAYVLHEEASQCRISSSPAPTPTSSDHHHVQSNMNNRVSGNRLQPPNHNRLQPPNHNRLQQRQHQQYHQGSGRRFPQAMPPSRQRYQAAVRQRPVVPRAPSNAPIYISVRRNVKVPLRRVPEVLKALSVQFYDTPHCPCCKRQLAVVADAAFMYCPHCTEISPLYGTIWPVGDFPEEPEYLRRGLGLGLTWGTMKKVFQEMYPRDYHHHLGSQSK